MPSSGRWATGRGAAMPSASIRCSSACIPAGAPGLGVDLADQSPARPRRTRGVVGDHRPAHRGDRHHPCAPHSCGAIRGAPRRGGRRAGDIRPRSSTSMAPEESRRPASTLTTRGPAAAPRPSSATSTSRGSLLDAGASGGSGRDSISATPPLVEADPGPGSAGGRPQPRSLEEGRPGRPSVSRRGGGLADLAPAQVRRAVAEVAGGLGGQEESRSMNTGPPRDVDVLSKPAARRGWGRAGASEPASEAGGSTPSGMCRGRVVRPAPSPPAAGAVPARRRPSVTAGAGRVRACVGGQQAGRRRAAPRARPRERVGGEACRRLCPPVSVWTTQPPLRGDAQQRRGRAPPSAAAAAASAL